MKFDYTRRATPAEAKAIREKRAKRTNDARALVAALVTEQVNALPKAVDGALGTKGDAGFSPLLAITEDGERAVLEIVDWVGGTGEKPTATGFVGEFGIVSDLADAVAIRGPAGRDGSDGADGKPGATIFVEPHNPRANEGADGDLFLNSKSGDVFRKQGGAWKLRGNLMGPRGRPGLSRGAGGTTIIKTAGGDDSASILMGSGPPPEGGIVGQQILVGSGGPPV